MSRRGGKKQALLAGGIVLVLLLTILALFQDYIRSWYQLWKQFERLADNEQGYAEYRHRETGIVFVRVPGGTFLMGSPVGDTAFDDQSPQHGVTLSPFLISKYEVSHAQWDVKRLARWVDDCLPAHGMSWEISRSFCERFGFSLPTEAQWEYACRAGNTGSYGSSRSLYKLAWYLGNASRAVHAVGQKTPNDFGIHDMHGNVWEWCEDVYDPAFYSTLKAKKNNPVCTSGSMCRIIRGGSYRSSETGCKSTFRGIGNPHNPNDRTIGIRPVYPAP